MQTFIAAEKEIRMVSNIATMQSALRYLDTLEVHSSIVSMLSHWKY